MNFLDLSLRQKLPLWGAALILTTAFAVSLTATLQAYDELREDQSIDAEIISRTLQGVLFPALANDNVWRAYEAIDLPFTRLADPDSSTNVETLVVIDRAANIYVSSRPRELKILSPLQAQGADYAWLTPKIEHPGTREAVTIKLEPPGSEFNYFATPIVRGTQDLGTLIVVTRRNVFMTRFFDHLWQGWIVGAILLAILVPINWLWGRRMTRPVVELARGMMQLDKGIPPPLDPKLYGHRDELGQMFHAYNSMLSTLREKQFLQQHAVQSERLAALGKLAAGVAHEINNPLGGMLTAIDTLKTQHIETDPRIAKTISLIERGLNQIRETVGALLVEARVKTRNLAMHDIDDIHTLIAPAAAPKALHLDWQSNQTADVPLPASLMRQVMINLVLNAVQAADVEGHVGIEVDVDATAFRFRVRNDGKLLDESQIINLFEPFSPLSEGGHGLGLWVTYQIVTQLGGKISAQRIANEMLFSVSIPLASES